MYKTPWSVTAGLTLTSTSLMFCLGRPEHATREWHSKKPLWVASGPRQSTGFCRTNPINSHSWNSESKFDVKKKKKNQREILKQNPWFKVFRFNLFWMLNKTSDEKTTGPWKLWMSTLTDHSLFNFLSRRSRRWKWRVGGNQKWKRGNGEVENLMPNFTENFLLWHHVSYAIKSTLRRKPYRN